MERRIYKILSSRAFLPLSRKIFRRSLATYWQTCWQSEVTPIGEIFRLIDEIKKEVELLLPFNEARNIYLAVISTRKVPGDIAEVGVYQGGSAKLICEAKGDKRLHLFDTFEGLPELYEFDDVGRLCEGQTKASLEDVKQYLAKYKNVYFYKGLFPSTAGGCKNESFSFVHLDVNLYEGTLHSLEFFYPRMSRGGIIISHDYPHISGVRKAVDEFFEDKPEPIVQIAGNQCLIVKTEV
jgi:O-methyltransferase